MVLIINQAEGAMMQPPNGQKSLQSQDIPKSFEDNPESEDDVFPQPRGEEFASREEVANAIEAAYKNNKNFQLKLVKYAERKIYEIAGSKTDFRYDPEDIVEEVINRILTLQRKWYKSRVERIENLIFMAIVSVIRIEAGKRPEADNPLYNRLEEGIEQEKKHKTNKRCKIIPLDYYKRGTEIPENTIVDVERYRVNGRGVTEDEFDFENIDEEITIQKLEKEFENDINAYYVFQHMLAGEKSNTNIAMDLGIDVKEVENAKKRIKRSVLKLLGITNKNTK